MGQRPERQSVRLCLDVSEFVAVVAELSAEIAQCPPEIVEGAVGACEAALEAARFQVDPSTASANDVIIRLEPSGRLRMLLAALRARDVDRLIVEKSRHG